MVALYITSTESAGKTALCAGIGRRLLGGGIKVGFFMPLQLSETTGADGRKDAAFIKEALVLKESIELLCPLSLPRQELWQELNDDVAGFTRRLKQAYRKIAQGKDIVIMEGLGDVDADEMSTLACYTIAETLEAKVIIALRYPPTSSVSKIVQIGTRLEHRLLGVVINFVPESRMEVVKRDLAAQFQEVGIRVLGVLPEIRSLVGATVGELAEILDAEILTAPDGSGAIAENIMLGAMTPDSGIDYFSRKADKVAVIRGERADMQLAALQTPTKCIILTNNVRPLPAVMDQAEEKKVPLMVVKKDTVTTITGIEEALAKASFRNTQKLQRFEEVLDCHFDFKALYLELGLKD